MFMFNAISFKSIDNEEIKILAQLQEKWIFFSALKGLKIIYHQHKESVQNESMRAIPAKMSIKQKF